MESKKERVTITEVKKDVLRDLRLDFLWYSLLQFLAWAVIRLLIAGYTHVCGENTVTAAITLIVSLVWAVLWIYYTVNQGVLYYAAVKEQFIFKKDTLIEKNRRRGRTTLLHSKPYRLRFSCGYIYYLLDRRFYTWSSQNSMSGSIEMFDRSPLWGAFTVVMIKKGIFKQIVAVYSHHIFDVSSLPQ